MTRGLSRQNQTVDTDESPLCAFLSQVLVLRELAISVPTFFFQQVQPFFDNIFVAVWDPKQAIREGAVAALRACLILTTQREPKEMQKPQWYRVSTWPSHPLQSTLRTASSGPKGCHGALPQSRHHICMGLQ